MHGEGGGDTVHAGGKSEDYPAQVIIYVATLLVVSDVINTTEVWLEMILL